MRVLFDFFINIARWACVSALRPARFFVLCIILSSQHRGIAKLVKAPDSDSGIRGFESFFPCHLFFLQVSIRTYLSA